jgi:hypothetical protein
MRSSIPASPSIGISTNLLTVLIAYYKNGPFIKQIKCRPTYVHE